MAGHLISFDVKRPMVIRHDSMKYIDALLTGTGDVFFEKEQKECRGCGAPKNNNKCEYCGGVR